ncbi:BamA/TamA family outer membrane protein [Kaarinaea lacus]
MLAIAATATAGDSPFINSHSPTGSQGAQLLLALLGSKEVPDFITLQKNKAVIGTITIKRGNVFDLSKPEENIPLFRLANSLHIETAESVIRNLLLFKSGDYFSQQIIDESERILRNTSYLYDAEIRLTKYQDNVVDIEVITRDVWTLTGSINFSREGGSNELSAEIEESNLLGYGKKLKLKTGSTVDRDETLLKYSDSQFLGTRSKITALYNDKSDGLTESFEIERPFYSLHSKWSIGLKLAKDDRTDPVYQFGEVVNAFDHTEENISVFFGLSEGYLNKHVYRWRFGFDKDRDNFSPNEEYPGMPMPEDRDFRFPWVALEIYEDKVIKTHHVTQIRRTEDLNLGNEINLKLGWSTQHFDAENDGLVYEMEANMAFKSKGEQLLLFNPFWKGRYADRSGENNRLGFKSRFYTPVFGDHVFYMALSANYVKDGYLDEQLLLGGDNGLRGYPLRFQSGDRSFLFTVEQRFYTEWHWFQLAYVGALVFFDIGRAWEPGTPENVNTRVLKDTGVGLRLASSRGSRGLVLHIDLAFPMDGDSEIDDVQLVITTKESF